MRCDVMRWGLHVGLGFFRGGVLFSASLTLTRYGTHTKSELAPFVNLSAKRERLASKGQMKRETKKRKFLVQRKKYWPIGDLIGKNSAYRQDVPSVSRPMSSSTQS